MAVAKVEGNTRKGAGKRNGKPSVEGGQAAMPQDDGNRLSELGEKIFLDRYALKDVTKETLAVGDTVVVCVDLRTGQREIGVARAIVDHTVTVELRDGTIVERATEHVDKPLELSPSQMLDRVARGVAAAEAPAMQKEWTAKFRWLMDDWKFVPAGRILTAAGSDQALTWYNCYVVPSPHDSRAGIVQTLSNMMEVMSRGGGVGINISSLRPRHAYVRGVNGRSSGAVSWGALYSFVTGLIEQGGCLIPDTLISTEKGLLRLDEIVTHSGKGWREHSLTVMTDEGPRLSRQVFNNGEAEVLKVRTDAGLTITGTPNHKVKVMTAHGPEWRTLGTLQTGDAILVKLGQHQGDYQNLRQPEYEHHNQDHVELPRVLDEELAFFLGYLAGDGFVASGDHDWRVGVSVAHSSYLIDEMPRLLERLFGGANVRKQQKSADASVTFVISNRAIKQFLQLNGFNKSKSAEACIPRLVRQSPPAVVGAFMRGLFEADGSPSHHYPSLLSSSKRLIDETAALLIGLGCPLRIDQAPMGADRLGTLPMWRLRLQSFRALQNWRSNVGCDPRSRFAACLEFEPDLTREISYVLPEPEYWTQPVLSATILPQIDHRAKGERFKATDMKLRRSLLRYTRGDRNLTLSAYTALCDAHPEFAEHAPPVNDTWFVFVDRVDPAGIAPTLDLEVDDNHTYLANGLVTHNSRRGALMLITNVWHPDVMEFISSKRDMGKITNANISVGITDDFMAAVAADEDWSFVFPDTNDPDYETLWDGNLEAWKAHGKKLLVHKTVPARDVWNTIIESAWASAEPGVFFVDRYNKMSNSWYFAPILCTNPCGEQGLPAWGVCNLGAINLAKFVTDSDVDWENLGTAIRTAVRFLDDVIDATPYFFAENQKQQKAERRVGLNTMGLAEMLIRLKIRYGSQESISFIDRLYRFIASEAYFASCDLAAEKGAFPAFDAGKFLQSGFMQSMPEEVRAAVREKGCRNVTLLTQAPNGTIGTMVGTSTGIEPFFFWTYYRKSRLGTHEERVGVLEEWHRENPDAEMPSYFVNAMELTPEEHVTVQAAIQRWVDSSISKTCNVPNHYTVEQTRELYELMYRLGCKGGTIYRDGSRNEQVLNLKKEDQPGDAAPARPLTQMEKVRPRPEICRGVTVKKATPVGTAFVTMNDDEAGHPFEVFVETGKTGSDIKAMAEAMGRLMSLVLRLASPLTPREKVQQIVNQVRGIGGARSLGFGKDRVRSLPDAVAQALEEQYGVHANGNGNGNGYHGAPTELPSNGNGHHVPTDLCPSCGVAAFVHEEGCMTCHSCGYSEC